MKKTWPIISVLSLAPFAVVWVHAFQWSIIDTVTPFLIGIIFCLFYLAWLISIIFSITMLLRARRWRIPKWYTPIVVSAGAFLVIQLIPFTDLWLKWDFLRFKSEREEVVAAISSGMLKPNVGYNPNLIALPTKWADTSRGGGDIVLETFDNCSGVYFFTYRGILGNSTGYVFIESDTTPKRADMVVVSKIAPHWYLIQTT